MGLRLARLALGGVRGRESAWANRHAWPGGLPAASYIPNAVHQCLNEGRPAPAEMRQVSVVFVNVTGIDVDVNATQTLEKASTGN